MSALKEVVAKAGGVSAAAGICGVSPRAVYKWLAADALPRTEYTGETSYAAVLAKAAGEPFSAEEILARGARRKAAA
ncbi:hypothetical protein BVH74_18245 [Halopseudomonas phragmitis]|uniref:Helix-turn-helix domain-containing protein n=1 Tax=Halopseudomonas phragmitis TaxID=1931241 RepID=A0A1V0B9K7_9GAMM|nr:hypothetical protein BVH74_18245 [Halopseudomonas phragmitis]